MPTGRVGTATVTPYQDGQRLGGAEGRQVGRSEQGVLLEAFHFVHHGFVGTSATVFEYRTLVLGKCCLMTGVEDEESRQEKNQLCFHNQTPECFEETYEFLNSLDVTQLHVFPYSERPGTSALSIPYVVSEKDKKERSRRLLDLSDQKTHDFYERHIGQDAEVLFEKATRGRAMHGFTKNYIRVELSPADAKAEYDNQLITGTLGEINHDKTALKWIK